LPKSTLTKRSSTFPRKGEEKVDDHQSGSFSLKSLQKESPLLREGPATSTEKKDSPQKSPRKNPGKKISGKPMVKPGKNPLKKGIPGRKKKPPFESWGKENLEPFIFS